jgi:hypothetical protein
MGFNLGKFLGNAVKTVGKPYSLVGKGIQSVDGAVTKEVDKIPVVGKPISAVIELSAAPLLAPYVIAGEVIDGTRIDHAVLGQFKKELQDYKEVAPYAETVIALAPGIGPGVSGIMAATLALADGQPISAAMIDAVKGAIPGGTIAAAVIDASVTGIQAANKHVPLTWDLVAKTAAASGADLANLPDTAKAAMLGALTTAGAITRGEKVPLAVADGAMQTASASGALPPTVMKALQVGTAITAAKLMQGNKAQATSTPTVQGRLIQAGRSIEAQDPVAANARKALSTGYNGFDLGVGASQMALTTADLVTLRNALASDDQKGFDLAMSLHIGRVANPAPSDIQNAGGQAGYFATMGMQGAPEDTKIAHINGMTKQPAMSVGAKVAMNQVFTARQSYFSRAWSWLKDLF